MYEILSSDLFDSFTYPSRTISTGSFKVNAYETPENWVVEAALPGVKVENVDVQVNDGLLEISVKKEENKKDEATNYVVREFNSQEYHRSLKIPHNITSDDVSAELKDGVLTVRLSKGASAKRKIEVKT